MASEKKNASDVLPLNLFLNESRLELDEWRDETFEL